MLNRYRRGSQIPARLHEGLPAGTEEGEEAARGWGVGEEMDEPLWNAPAPQ